MGLLEKAKELSKIKELHDDDLLYDDFSADVTDIDDFSDKSTEKDIEAFSHDDGGEFFSEDENPEHTSDESWFDSEDQYEDDFFSSGEKINEINLDDSLDEITEYGKEHEPVQPGVKGNDSADIDDLLINSDEFFPDMEPSVSADTDIEEEKDISDTGVLDVGNQDYIETEPDDMFVIESPDSENDYLSLSNQDSSDTEPNESIDETEDFFVSPETDFDDSDGSSFSTVTPDGEILTVQDQTADEAEGVRGAGRIRDIPTGEDRDAAVLHEISKEIMRSISLKELHESLLFILMGQIGAGGALILGPSGDPEKWHIIASSGVQLKSRNVTFRRDGKILASLLVRNETVMLKEFEGNRECREEYLKFMSIDARELFPVSFEGRVKFAMVTGEKLTGGEYSDEERFFIGNICDTAGIVAERLDVLEQLRNENTSLKKQDETLSHLDAYEEKIRTSDSEDVVRTIVDNEMKDFGVQSYAFFFRDELSDCFRIRYNEQEDYIGMAENGFTVGLNNAFTAYLMKNGRIDEIENPVNSEFLRNVFSSSHLTKINIFAACPYIVENVLAGFLIIFRADTAKFRSNRVQVMRFCKTLFMNLLSRQGISPVTDSYVDNYALEIKRMQNTLTESSALDIPVSFAMFGVKNLRRYTHEAGELKTAEFLKDMTTVIRGKIAKTDYMIRTSYNKFLLVMPGIVKKNSLLLCNALKKDISGLSKKYDFQFLVTFVQAEFPADGRDVHAILDIID